MPTGTSVSVVPRSPPTVDSSVNFVLLGSLMAAVFIVLVIIASVSVGMLLSQLRKKWARKFTIHGGML